MHFLIERFFIGALCLKVDYVETKLRLILTLVRLNAHWATVCFTALVAVIPSFHCPVPKKRPLLSGKPLYLKMFSSAFINKLLICCCVCLFKLWSPSLSLRSTFKRIQSWISSCRIKIYTCSVCFLIKKSMLGIPRLYSNLTYNFF